MVERLLYKWRRLLAGILAVVLTVTGIQIPVFADNNYSNYLDGWKVQVAWNTLSTDYEWHADSNETRQPKIVVTYRMEQAQKDYPAGSLSFTIPGIGAANRGSIIKANKLAADQEDSEWNYEWDQEQDLYTFTNKFEVKTGQSVSGGFELLWTLNARDCEDGFSQSKSPVFFVDGVGSILMEPLSYEFTSEKDLHRIYLSKSKLSVTDYESADKSYVWYNVSTRVDDDILARGLYRYSYFVSVELPEEVTPADIKVEYGGREITLTENENGELGFYPFEERLGETVSVSNIRFGFKQDVLEGREVTVRSHLDRLFDDEIEWVTEAGENEFVDAELTFTVESYRFIYSGYIYSHNKSNSFYESYNGGEPSDYTDRLNAVNLYNGKIVPFRLYGFANRQYSQGRKMIKTSTSVSSTDEITIPEGIEDWNDIHWNENGLVEEELDDSIFDGPTYGEIYEEIYQDKIASSANADKEVDHESSSGSQGGNSMWQKPDTNSQAEIPDEIPTASPAEAELFVHSFIDDFSSFFRKVASVFAMTSYAAEEVGKATPPEADKPTGEPSGNLAKPQNEPSVGVTDDSELLSDQNPTKPGGNTSGMSQIGEDQEYSLVLGDDKLVIYLNDGSVRNLKDEEYDIAYVTTPYSGGYEWELYGAPTQDTHFDDYVLLSSGNSGKTVQLPAGVKAVFVRVNGIVGSYSYNIDVGVRLHLDWAAEQEKEEALRPSHENRLVNFSYLRSLFWDEEGMEVNDCAVDTENYSGTYGLELADRDAVVYDEQLYRDYSNVWLRSSVTELNTSTSLSSVSGDVKSGFSTTITSSGTIKADDEGSLERFSLYTVVPEGMQVDFDNTEIKITGSGTALSGEAISNFADYGAIDTREYRGQILVVADFDFSNNPLQVSSPTSVSISFEATLGYADYLEIGNRYTAETYLMAHDDGLDKISGSSVRNDIYDLDQDGSAADRMSYSSASRTILDDATEWREYISKYVKSFYSGGYVDDTVTRLYSAADSAADREKSKYSYRLDFGLGSSNAKNVVFYDRIEQGAQITDPETEGEYTEISSEWQGRFLSVDTSKVESMGLIPTVYYSVDPDQEMDLTTGGWTTECPVDVGSVKAIAVSLDTSEMPDGVMKTKQMTYVTVNMQAPADRDLIEKTAVNQYTIQYDAYGLTGNFEKTYILTSAETYLKLLDNVGKIVLQKVDLENVTGTTEDGKEKYAPLTGAKFQIYDPSGKPMFGEEGKELNSMGRIVINNVRQGMYSWEELQAPLGYEKIEGRQPFEVDGVLGTIEVGNKRIPGQVTLTKQDQNHAEYGPLSGAEFALYRSDESQVFTDASYQYSETGENNVFATGPDGTLTVTGLPWGSYYFKETKAPEGYELSALKVSFTVGKGQLDSETDTISVSVEAFNQEKTASILLKKKDFEDGRPVRNATFSLYREADGEDELVSKGLKSNAAGEVMVDGLRFGTYYFVETRNAGGYLMPDAAHARTDSVTLDASTAEKTLEVSMTNDRMEGSVVLTKKDDVGQLVGGAVYGLWYHASGADQYTKIGSYTTDADRQSETYGELRAENLKWGDYYFLEEKAPVGYELSGEQVKFTIDKDTVQNTIYLDVIDNRLTGSVKLLKVDKADHEKKLEGAVYELYRTDGTKCVAGTDYQLPADMTEIKTGSDGSVVLTGLKQGGYYFKEVTAPAGYSLSSEPVRFSVTKENATVVQEIVAEDEAGKAVIIVHKKVNDVFGSFGTPTFVFTVMRDDGEVYRQSVTLSEENPEGTVVFDVEQGHIYRIEEEGSSRYLLNTITAGVNTKVEGTGAVADLMDTKNAEVTFENAMEQYEKFSHVGNATNIVKPSVKLTGISTEYIGLNPVTQDLPGYDAEEEIYTIPKSDLVVTAFYDDGTNVVLEERDFSIDPTYADGSSDSFTGTVTYQEDGTKKTASFQFDVELPAPTPRHTVTFDLDGGTIIPDGGTSAQSSLILQVKEGREITKPKNDPVKEGYIFEGWFLDADCTTEADFPVTMGKADKMIYAKWKQDVVKVKYAVSIYGIMQDVDNKGQTVGLTFGPATGESYINTYKDHVPSEGQMCMHHMTWKEIIAQSQENPRVFQECLENGCTHSVELTIAGKLAEGATSYPDMTGDGAGMLRHSVNENRLLFATDAVVEWMSSTNYAESMIRATLNGEDGYTHESHLGIDKGESLIKMLPLDLQNGIMSRQIQEYEIMMDDKIWLLSENNITPGTRRVFDEMGVPSDWWLRDVDWDRSPKVFFVNQEGVIDFMGAYGSSIQAQKGIAFGFSIPGPQPDVRYAVSLYGIKHDTYKDEDGNIGTAGLTFGPATGRSYVDTYASHAPTGVNGFGNAYRCIHNDDWATIAFWSQKDPYVYEQCLDGDGSGESCTKSVPIILNDKLKGTSYPKMTGDGAGSLCDSIAEEYKRWNWSESKHFISTSQIEYRNGSNQGGWPDSAIRNTLNGTITDNLLNITNKDNGFDEAKLDENTALISCFPIELKEAIVPKAVRSDTVYNDVSSNSVVTYDKLWLLSVNEAYIKSGDSFYDSAIRPNEGTPYERTEVLNITTIGNGKDAGYDESGDASYRWLRSAKCDSVVEVYRVMDRGGWAYSVVDHTYKFGLTPAFCLK